MPKRLIPPLLLAGFLGLLGLFALRFPPQQVYPVAVVNLPGLGEAHWIAPPVGSQTLCVAQQESIRRWLALAWQGSTLRSGACRPSPAPDLAQILSARPLERPSLRTDLGVLLLDGQSVPPLVRWPGTFPVDGSTLQFTPAGSPRPGLAATTAPPSLARDCYLLACVTVAALLTLLLTLTRPGLSKRELSPIRARLLGATALLVGDLLVLLSGLLLITFARESWYAPIADQEMTMAPANASVHALLSAIVVIWLGPVLQHYTRRRPFWDEFAETIRVLFTVFLLACTFSFLFRLDSARGTLLLVWAAAVGLIPLMRRCVRDRLEVAGLWWRPAVIIGLGGNAAEAAQAISSEGNLGYRVTGFLPSGLPGEGASPAPDGAPLVVLDAEVRTPAEIAAAIVRLGSPEIVLAVESLSTPEAAGLVQTLSLRFSGLHIIPTIRGLPLFGTTLSHFFRHEVLFLTLRNTLRHRGLQALKRSFDLVGALTLLVVLSPLLLGISLWILASGGSPLYRHRRIGRGGQHFACLKFRSMRPDAEQVLQHLLASDAAARAEWARDFKLKDDPRITRIGRVLRRTSLDELPQLWNVVLGDMSLVGPRPIIDDELARYGEQASLYLEVRPGITGLWQVSGRNDTDYTERVALDSWYVQNWSLWYDIIILFQTVDTVLARRGAY